MSAYPCPYCGVTASSDTGCPGCGRPADRLAAELTWIAGRIQVLNQVTADLQKNLTVAMAERGGLVQRHTVLGEQLRQRMRAEGGRPPVPGAAAVPPVAATVPGHPVPVRQTADASPKSVQNVLLGLGGLLLGIAAIVFVVVAWRSFGVAGRAGLLAGVTGLLLALPVPLARKQLGATAETLAAVGLLFVALDGYAAWIVDFAGVQAVDGAGYAAGVLAVTAAFSLGYGKILGLQAPRFAALIAIQPVPVLVAVVLDASLAGYSVAFTAGAAINLAAGWRALRGDHSVLRWLAVSVAGPWTLVAGATAIVAAIPNDTAIVGCGALLLIGVLAASLTPVQRMVFPAFATGPLVVVVARLVWLWLPDHRMIGLVAAAGALVLAARFLPEDIRPGPLSVTGLVAGLAGIVTSTLAVVSALIAAGSAQPPWSGEPYAFDDLIGWQLPAALLTGGLVAWVLFRKWWIGFAVAALLSISAPGELGAPYWTIAAAPLLVALLVSLYALRAAPWLAIVSAALAAYGLTVCLHTPQATTAGLAAVVVTAGLVAGLGRTTVLGSAAFTTTLLFLPALAAVGAHTAGLSDRYAAIAGMGGATLALGLSWLLRVFEPWTSLAVAAGATGVAISTVFMDGEPTTVYAAYAALLSVAGPYRNQWLVIRAALPLGWAVGGALPSLAAVLVAPWLWWLEIWSGASGTGIAPRGNWSVSVQDLVVLVMVAAAAGIAAGPARIVKVAVPAGILVAFVLPAALGAPWPVTAVVALVLGLAAWVIGPGVWLSAVAVAGAGAGFSGLLADRMSTVGALVAVLAAAVVVAWRGRLSGYVTGGVAFLVLAPVTCAAGRMDVATCGYALLGAAVVLLAVSAWVRKPQPVPVLEILAHAGAGVSLVLAGRTLRSAAIVFAVWAAVLGASALRRDLGGLGRRAYALAGAGLATVSWWLLLGAGRVGVPEAYTVPPAVLLLAIGAWEVHRRPELRSWIAYGPGLLVALLPSFAWSLGVQGPPLRRVYLGVAAVLIVLIGAKFRLRAPLAIGGGIAAAVGLHELLLIGVKASFWIPSAVAGVILIAVGATYEKRLRDLTRLRDLYTSFR
ncbi:SCO7613 C-terminal domain-containing membrane protein [Longispora albida]|uniref:SCO7613 C-terminal domain-containing membrane protein n=1 Tax=Longispora albida TaxID=203523 RepID=UPI00036B4142|nr:hypothetical protein [Longispora albida]